MTHRILWIVALWLLSGLAAYESCGIPPTVEFGTVRMKDEDDTVLAIYACNSGYTLEGEIELYCDPDTGKWNSDPPTCVKIQSEDDGDENNEENDINDTNSQATSQERKKKTQDILEDPHITAEYAENLDMTCVSARVKAPEIPDGFVQKYDRRRKGESTFIVAFYSCNDNFELENSERNNVYCSKKKWIGELPKCIALNDYNEEEYEEYDEGGEEEDEDEDEEEVVKKPQPPKTEKTADAVEVEYTVKVSEEVPDEVAAKADAATDVNFVVEPTVDPYTPRILNQSCGPDKGGCDHNCEMVLYPGENEPRVVCTCSSGFTLDPYNYRLCHDIDECSINNGGCEQTCKNIPGSFECTCQEGLQIDTVTGNTCIDVNECLLRNGHGPCQDTCFNTFGSYSCSCDGLPGTKLSDDRISCEDNGECAINNGGCSHICLATLGRVFCLCPSGFALSKDWKNCQDINECESVNIASRCPGGCENTVGSYVCQPKPITEETINSVVQSVPTPTHSVQCEEGFRQSSDGNCVDIDECAEGIAKCENCRNNHGSYDCICPTGYELSEDEVTCVDINECESNAEEQAQPVCSHLCENTQGSFICKCKELYHLSDDQKTCIKDSCQDMGTNKSQCSYYCEDTEDGPLCKCPEKFELAADKFTCLPSATDACHELGGNERCLPGRCANSEDGSYKCSCPAGFRDEVYVCKDIDECSEGTHSCSHICFNTEGSFVCQCPIGFQEMEGNSSSCVDIDECSEKDGVCGERVCKNTDGGFSCLCPDGSDPDQNNKCVEDDMCSSNNGGCSHTCSSLEGRVTCMCPSEMKLSEDGYTCIHLDPCTNANNGCSQICNSLLQGTCSCESGFELQEDGKTCVDYDECIDNNGGCEHICVNKPGGYDCVCKKGYVPSEGNRCFDVDECALDTHNCASGLLCQNLNGSYACQCPRGLVFARASSTECSDIDECSLNNGNCSDFCINLHGSFQCSCPSGKVLTDDEKTCDYVDGCLIDNGGCSHKCVFNKPHTTCACPYGYALDSDGKTCIDVDECVMGRTRTKCSHLCVNTVGSFVCACPGGYALAANERDCFDKDECVDNNGNCSNICINLLGSFSCACDAGFELREDLRTCTDVDECYQALHDCSHYCVNVVGGYDCSCPAGFVLGPNKRTCIDVDECEGYSTCSHNCRNTLGSFECVCPSGMILDDDKKTCVNGDFCSRLQPKCSHVCKNVDKGFECACPQGLQIGSDSLTCVDINECLVDNGGCSHTCTNLEGSYSCLCPAGFKLGEDDKICQDINECDVDNGGCEHYCINAKGRHSCECSQGFALQDDGRTCRVSDPCRNNNGGCEQLCLADGKCACRPGYVLNPFNSSSCYDMDECQVGNPCPGKSCRNTPGSYECFCEQGYTIDGYGRCIDINECEYQNAGCPGECVNIPGSYECKCPRGLRPSTDRKTCLSVRNQCQPFRPPKYGEIHCTRSRHKTHLYYKTRCSVWCTPGYQLEGPAIRHCGASGQWDNFENRCIPQMCPRLPRAEYGTILPATCLLGKTYVGERCLLHCQSGFMPAGRKVNVCNVDQTWSSNSTFDCIPISTPIFNAPHESVDVNRRYGVPQQRPFIKCPRNTTVLLPLGHKTAHIILQKPKTNMDYRYVQSFPPWSRNLQAHLGAGVHVITFRGHEPTTRRGATCRTVITVKNSEPPKVTFCPPSFEITLGSAQEKRSIVWKEPEFESPNHIRNIQKSNIPGQLFAAGVHRISYEAVNDDGLTARCEFNLVVKAPQIHSLPYTYDYPSQAGERSSKLLANHDSYIICNGQSPVKIYGTQSINIPPGCVIKHIRINPVRHQYLRRRLITHRWTPFGSF